MRVVKIVAYGSVSEDNERLVDNYLEDKGFALTIFAVNTPLEHANKVIADQNALLDKYATTIAELRAGVDVDDD